LSSRFPSEPWKLDGIAREALRKELKGTAKTPTLDEIPIITTKAARYKGNPVLSRGGAGEWDEGRVDNPCVIYDGGYKMWYSGQDINERNGKIGLATSADGISFTKSGANPIFDDIETPSGYTNHNTEVAAVIIHISEGTKTYYMIYEQSILDATWNRVGVYNKFASSSDGISWANMGDLTPFEPGVWWDGGKIFVDREGTFHYVVGKFPNMDNITEHAFYHFHSSDFKTWTMDSETLDLSAEIFGGGFRRVDDLEIFSLGGLLIGLANYFTKNHIQPLEMLAGYKWNRLKWIGNCIYPAKEISEGLNTHTHHEASFVVGPESYGPCPRIYYFMQWDPAVAAVTKDINMAYLMFGRKRNYPIVEESTLGDGVTTSLDDCTEIPLEGVSNLALTCVETYAVGATLGARLCIYTSIDGVNYDSEPIITRDFAFTANTTKRETFYPTPTAQFMKVTVENLDAAQDISDLKIIATLSR